jgi:Xaa-Pro aminopeptidase
MDHAGRIERLRSKLEAEGVHGLLVTQLTNVRYLTGFSGTNGQVLITSSDAIFFSDGRYRARAADVVQAADVEIYPDRLSDVLPSHLRRNHIQKLGVEGTTMTLAQHDDLTARLDGVELVATKNLVEDLRRLKEAAEIELIREAVRIGDETFQWVCDRIESGLRERELALELEVQMRRAGSEGVSFPPIVASGPLSAHIHHTSGERQVEKGDLVLLDFGCRVDGYCSDLTRTVVVGRAGDEQRALHELVLEAQNAGLDAVAAGAAGADVDATARRIVDGSGHKDDFGHGLGHGVGLDVHEAPRLHWTSEDTLRAGDVVTVEPGIYVIGSGGIRIEDCVLVTETGADVLTQAPKHKLIEV